MPCGHMLEESGCIGSGGQGGVGDITVRGNDQFFDISCYVLHPVCSHYLGFYFFLLSDCFFFPLGFLVVPLAGAAAGWAFVFFEEGLGLVDVDFFFLLEAPVFFGWPLLEFFGVVLGVDWFSWRFNWPSSAEIFFVLRATSWRMRSSRSSLSTLVSVSRRFLVASVASSREVVAWSFLRDRSISISSARAK